MAGSLVGIDSGATRLGYERVPPGEIGADRGGAFGLGWMLFHLLVIPLQAFIFMMLSIVYLSLVEDSH